MKSEPIEPAALAFDAAGDPFSERFGDRYHPRAGAALQAAHVFLRGNGLPERWRGRERFVVLETGFGLGHNFLATWQAWRDDPQRCARLDFISIERHPLPRAALAQVHAGLRSRALAQELVAQWPPATHNLYSLGFEGAALRLMLAFGDAAAWLPELVAEVDAFFLDGFAPDRNPQMWQPRIFKALARLAVPGATASTWTVARAVREGLTAAGFEVERGPGTGGKRDITLARYAPHFRPRRAPARHATVPAQRHALIVGAGLAGCATARALAEQGWTCELFDPRDGPAQEASGNPGGLFHGVVTPQDGAHARWYRAAALACAAEVRAAIASHGVAGEVQGLIRLDDADDARAMKACIDRLGLPPDFVRALDAEAGGALAGVALARPAWFYLSGGWVDPAGLAASFLARAGDALTRRFGTQVHTITKRGALWQALDAQGRVLGEAPQIVLANAGDALTRRFGTQVHTITKRGALWQALDAQGRVLGEAPQIVLANAGDALRLLGAPDWPIEPRRGQVSLLDTDAVPLLRPVSGHGYALRLPDGRLLFGASSQPNDGDPAVRASDHASNLAQLAAMLGTAPALDRAVLSAIGGRTGWRWSSRDRLPVIGAVPDEVALAAPSVRLDQPRFVPRREGLFVFTALGSRGISSATLGAQVLAALMTGAPCPVEASLLDAIDPARFVSRAARRSRA
jgi:tRNA 5-methylaminomethyl-2-thiouridine biosynthesis bifunctional protein